MTRTMDLIKFRKDITKSIPGVGVGYSDPDTWVSTGNYALNYAISSNFKEGGIPLGKVTVFAGESGSGKSYICSGNAIKSAQDQGILVVLIDTENALDEKWLNNLGVDTSDEKLLKMNMSMIDDIAKTISEFMKVYVESEMKQQVLFVIDSLGMTMVPAETEQFHKGDMKGDMGRKPKALTSLVRNCINLFSSHNVGLLATNHTYASQNIYDPDDKISGGGGFIYASSIVVAMGKAKLKEDENGNKIKDTVGIKAKCKVMKTRFAKPFQVVDLKIPYDTGLDPYSGLVEMFEGMNLLKKSGNRLLYTGADGTEIIKFRKAWEANDNGDLDTIMAEVMSNTATTTLEGAVDE